MSNEELVILIQQGIDTVDNMALLYEKTKKFIRKVAYKYKGVTDIEDLEQEGYFGLCEAVQKYDPDQGVRFLSYAGNWINQYMRRYIENNGNVVRIPSHAYRKMLKYDDIVKRFQCLTGRMPTDRDLRYYLEISQEQLIELEKNRSMLKIGSTDSILPGVDNDITVGETIASSENMENDIVEDMAVEQLKQLLWSEVDSLPPEQSAVIRSKYMGNLTLEAAGQQMGITGSKARTYESKALRELRRRRSFMNRVKEFDVIQTHAYRSSVTSFDRTWTSSTEYAALKLLEI